MTIDPRAYNMTVRRDIFDGVELFEVRVKELPDLVEYGETFPEAYELAIDTIATAAAAYHEQGRAFPVAQIPADDYRCAGGSASLDPLYDDDYQL